MVVHLQWDAAVPPRGGEVDVLGDEAAVGRRVSEKHDGQGGETVGYGAQAEQEKHLLLERSPFSEEGGGSFVVGHPVWERSRRTEWVRVNERHE